MDEGDTIALEASALLPLAAAAKYRSVAVDTESGSKNEMAKTITFGQDIIDTFHLALPIFVSRVSYVGVSCCCSFLRNELNELQ